MCVSFSVKIIFSRSNYKIRVSWIMRTNCRCQTNITIIITILHLFQSTEGTDPSYFQHRASWSQQLKKWISTPLPCAWNSLLFLNKVFLLITISLFQNNNEFPKVKKKKKKKKSSVLLCRNSTLDLVTERYYLSKEWK